MRPKKAFQTAFRNGLRWAVLALIYLGFVAVNSEAPHKEPKSSTVVREVLDHD